MSTRQGWSILRRVHLTGGLYVEKRIVRCPDEGHVRSGLHYDFRELSSPGERGGTVQQEKHQRLFDSLKFIAEKKERCLLSR